MTFAKSVAKRKEGSEAVRRGGQEVYCMSQERRAAAAFTRKSHLRDQLMRAHARWSADSSAPLQPGPGMREASLLTCPPGLLLHGAQRPRRVRSTEPQSNQVPLMTVYKSREEYLDLHAL